MFKHRRLVCLALMCALVGVAYGAARKIRAFDSATYGFEPPDADGMAILNYVTGDDKTLFQIVLSGFTPNFTYSVGFVAPGADPDPGVFCSACGVTFFLLAITTDDHGNATWHHNDLLPGDFSSNNVGIYSFEDSDPGPGVNNIMVLRALGTQ